jgi:hypothetical protein
MFAVDPTTYGAQHTASTLHGEEWPSNQGRSRVGGMRYIESCARGGRIMIGGEGCPQYLDVWFGHVAVMGAEDVPYALLSAHLSSWAAGSLVWLYRDGGHERGFPVAHSLGLDWLPSANKSRLAELIMQDAVRLQVLPMNFLL